jgi:hypothetical protein
VHDADPAEADDRDAHRRHRATADERAAGGDPTPHGVRVTV